MKKPIQLSRRTFLKSAGVTLYLPFLEAMLPRMASAEVAPPKRFILLNVPNGMEMPSWTPSNTGTNFTLSSTLQPLAGVKNKLMVLSGLDTKDGGGGDHGWGSGTYLTQADISRGDFPQAGTSVDQVIGQLIGSGTRSRTINLGMQPTSSDDVDGWKFSDYISTMSWESPTKPFPKVIDPAKAFQTLFSGTTSTAPAPTNKQLLYKRSILDAVLAQATDLRVKLGTGDRAKLDDYMNSIREIELQIGSVTTPSSCTVGSAPPSSSNTPTGDQYATRMKIMLDLIVLACQCDATRVFTFQLAQEGSWIVYDVSRNGEKLKHGHHGVSHYAGTEAYPTAAENHAWLAAINQYHVQQYAYLLGRLNAISEGTGTMLDNSVTMYGSAMSDSHDHVHTNQPTLLVGGSNYITGNRHIDYGGVSLSNLYLSLIKMFGGTQTKFGYSGGFLPSIKV